MPSPAEGRESSIEEEEEFCIESAIPADHLHCYACFDINCEREEPCPVIYCHNCGIRLHKCKLDDHIENICDRAPSQCPNANYGCPVQLRRHLLAAHLAQCPASIVHCPFIKNRQFVNNKAKKMLKKIAKGQCPKLEIEEEMLEGEEMLVPDVAFSRIDQDILERFFRTRREWRRRLKPSAIHFDDLADAIELSPKDGQQQQADEDDSSDEEKRATERQHKAIREPFAGCRLCRLNPGSQHLHELGSMRVTQQQAEENQRKSGAVEGKGKMECREDDPFKFLPEFFRKRAILIQPDIAFSSVVPDEHYLHVNYPIAGCPARFVRRDRFHAHYRCHLALEETAPGSLVARCPNWQYGCPFRVDARRVKGRHNDDDGGGGGGQLKFSAFLSACVHLPLARLPIQSRWPLPTSAGHSLDQLPAPFFALLAPHLDDASLRALASSCRRLRQLLPALAADRLSVELVWRRRGEEEKGKGRNGGKFIIVGLRKWFAPVQDGPPPLCVHPQSALIDHLQRGCAHGEAHDHGQAPIDLRRFHGAGFPAFPCAASALPEFFQNCT